MEDGTFAIVDDGTYITIDVNGWQNGPNRLGHDFFMFQIVNGHLTPMGDPKTNQSFNVCSKTSTSSYNGRGCTIKAVSDPDYFKNLPR